MKTIGIFGTPISVKRDFINIGKDEKNIIEDCSWSEMANKNYFTDDYKILEKLPNIKQKLEDVIKQYGKEILGFKDNNELYITNSWAVKTPTGGFHPAHNHPNSIMSGVLYINVGVELGNFEQGIIFEHEPQILNKFNFLFDKNDTNWNTSRFAVQVNSGDLVMFPSWLKHEVKENTTETTRLVIGFNTFIKGRFGENNYPTDLKL